MDLKQFTSEIVPLRPKMLFVACRLTENEADAEDAVQEALLRMWNNRKKLNAIANPGGFAMQITKNICIDKIRTRKEVVSPEVLMFEFNQQNPYSDTESNDSIQIVKQIIAYLPELQKRIIWMRDVEGFELEEIAQIIGTQVSAVTMNLSRARKKVREQFININAYHLNNPQK